MKRIAQILLLSALLPAAAAPAREADTTANYTIQVTMLSVPRRAMTDAAVKLTADRMTTATGGVWYAGGSLDTDGVTNALEQLKSLPDAEVLSAPSVLVPAGKPATISIGQQLAYLKPAGGDLYRLVRLDEKDSAGIRLGLTARPDGAGRVRLDVDFALNLLLRMSELAGTTFRVGEPVIAKRSFATTVSVRPGRHALLGGANMVGSDGEEDEEERLLILVRVDETSP